MISNPEHYLKIQTFHKLTDPIKNLPKVPGVYFFYHYQKNNPVYIGKSLNIRQRIQSHFQIAKTNNKTFKITHFAQKIGFIETAGEIGALLLESKMIKAFMPCFNKRLIRTKSLVTIVLQSENGLLQPKFVRFNPGIRSSWSQCYGLFHNNHTALTNLEKFCQQEKMCRKMLGLEKTYSGHKRPCFAYDLGDCMGACVNQEAIALHNQKLKQYLDQLQLVTWPFASPILIKEKSASFEDTHLIDHWQYIKTDSKPSNSNTESRLDIKRTLDFSMHQSFDKDIYLILCPILRSMALGENHENFAIELITQ